VIVRERGGNSVPAVFTTESQAASFIRARIAKGTVVHADEAASWDNLHERFEVERINHQEAYSLDGACTNVAEEYFSRLCRAEIGIHHHIAGSYLLRCAQESAWPEDNRRVSNGDEVNRIASLALKRGNAVGSRRTLAASCCLGTSQTWPRGARPGHQATSATEFISEIPKFHFPPDPNQSYMHRCLAPYRGVSRSSRTRSGMRWTWAAL
jgi:hypothetical protein